MLRAPAREVKSLCKGVMLMRKENSKKLSFLAILLCIILTAVSVVCLAGCKNDGSKTDKPVATAAATAEAEPTAAPEADKVSFKLVVVGKDGTEKTFDLESSKKMLGEALVDENLVSGTTSAEYGLMVDTVDGVKLDYNTDGYYWAFYINGEYAMTGVDSTPITEGAVYKFAAAAG